MKELKHKDSLFWFAENVRELAPLRRVTLTGTDRMTPPPPVLGWSTITGVPPLTLQKIL